MTIQQCKIGCNTDRKTHSTAQQLAFNIGTADIKQVPQRTPITILRLYSNHQPQPILTSQPLELNPGLLRIKGSDGLPLRPISGALMPIRRTRRPSTRIPAYLHR